ncbi:MAG: anhydro-N-acetylmuramic acid kinase [Xanthomonadales bacterium]|nr:Anhydro-N-acetylmuramic acid kinase [Xanthomonadales bacterium]MCC6591814.1 anhydro-N-acetylmuramic acid kinase [Xanthomonadales bacterium]MCE7931024.1 anhydro-N-acetylmuramic acid kinase [Xanthomonadales bacterium PRO6]
MLYLGLISGTSADGIDAALLRFDPRLELLAARTFDYPSDLRRRVLELMTAPALELDAYGALDAEVGEAFADAAMRLLEEAGVGRAAVAAIGSHGQTVRHRPGLAHPFTLQIGDPNRIAERSGIRTVADFRRRDIAAGGQGAPLVCALHAALFADAAEVRAVLNLGGIGNLTLLEPARPLRGFDTGPANCLMDAWAQRHLQRSRDENGEFAACGRAHAPLLEELLADEYFARPPPKSTGREHFHLDWLDERLTRFPSLPIADVQATLLALSARSIALALRTHAPATTRTIACGGGVHNRALMHLLASELPLRLGHDCVLETTTAHGLDPDFVEAAAFAWLARQTLLGLPGNCVEVTGAIGPRVLGAIHAG